MKRRSGSQIIVRDLKSADRNLLTPFLLTLKPRTLHYWNRFGTKFDVAHAAHVSQGQISKNVREEKGFVACVNGEVVGYSYLRFFPDKPQKSGTASLGMVVRDDYQGKGVGTQLMKSMIDYCKKKRLKKIWLATYSDNKQTHYFYKRFGFYPEGVFLFDEYFGPKPRHVISMAKFLRPSLVRRAKILTKEFLLR